MMAKKRQTQVGPAAQYLQKGEQEMKKGRENGSDAMQGWAAADMIVRRSARIGRDGGDPILSVCPISAHEYRQLWKLSKHDFLS